MSVANTSSIISRRSILYVALHNKNNHHVTVMEVYLVGFEGNESVKDQN